MYPRKKKIAAVFLATVMLSACALTGCGSQSEGSAASTSEIVEEVAEETAETGVLSEYAGQALMGTVVSVDGNEITLDISRTMDAASLTEMQAAGAASDGSAPEMPEGGSDMGSADGAAPEMPEGGADMDGADGSAPEKPEGDSDMGSADGSAPEKPEGDSDMGSADGSAPEMPEDGADTGSADGAAPEMPEDGGDMGGETETFSLTVTIADESVLTGEDGTAISLSDLEEGDSLVIVVDENGEITSVSIWNMGDAGMGQPDGMSMDQAGGMGQPGGGSSGVDSYTAVNEYSEATDLEGETFTSTGTDENAVLVDGGADVTITDSEVTRTSQDSTGGDNSSFYGVGAAVLVTDGTVTVEDSEITTDAAGGAGVFAYGDGVAYVSDSVITTEQDTSGGIHVAGGGTLYAENLTVETNGESAAAIRSDRGGGTMNVSGGSYTSNGVGSPAVYCTADITIEDADLTAAGSEAVCIEGLNTLNLTDCVLSGNMSDNEQNDCTWTVIVYQSMSGDSEVGNGTFSMTGGELISGNGGLFYTTNTECTFYLSGVTITPSDDNAFFLQCTGNTNARGWGSSGSNGSQCTFTADDQVMEGDIIYDSISTLDFIMQNGSTLTGAIYDDETWAGSGGDGYCNVTIDDSSVWVVTADSVVSQLQCSGQIVDAEGNTVTIIGADQTVYVQGTSSLTVTVDSYQGA